MNRLLLLVALVASAAGAVDVPNKSAQPQPFEVNLTITEKGSELFDTWDRPTGKPFNVEPIKVATRGKFLSAVVLFKGCQPDAYGNCNAVMDIVALDPKGKTYGECREWNCGRTSQRRTLAIRSSVGATWALSSSRMIFLEHIELRSWLAT